MSQSVACSQPLTMSVPSTLFVEPEGGPQMPTSADGRSPAVGMYVGAAVGFAVGDDVGLNVGVDVGPEVGEGLGAGVGILVGADVGAGVLHVKSALQSRLRQSPS